MLDIEFSQIKRPVAAWKRAAMLTAEEQHQACDLLREAMFLVECELPYQLCHDIEKFLTEVGSRTGIQGLN